MTTGANRSSCDQPRVQLGGRGRHLRAAALAAVLWSVPAQPLVASQDGIPGYSGKQGESCDDFCHAEGQTPLVRFDGPNEVPAGALASFRFAVESDAPAQTVAGLDVAASAGSLAAVTADTRLDVDEITHSSPKTAVEGEASWEFTWRAPSQPGTQTLYGAGLSANSNGSKSGDGTAKTTKTVTVTAAAPVPIACVGDCSADAEVTVDELVTGVNIALGNAALVACPMFDAGQDGEVTVDELVTAVNNALGGCPGPYPIVFSGESNRLNAYDAGAGFDKQTVIERHSVDPNGFDINGQICFLPDGSHRFIAGEDTFQPEPPPAWGLFQLQGAAVGALSATRLGRLVPTYQPGLEGTNNEPYGCGFLSDGRLVTSDLGNQASGDGTGQLIIWFPPLDAPNPRFCKLDIAVATAGGVLVDQSDRVYVASARAAPNTGGPGVYRYTGPFPTSDDAAGNCGQLDSTGAPLADAVQKALFIAADVHIATPSGVARTRDGHFYVTSVFNGVIAEYDGDGHFLRRILEPPAGSTPPTYATGNPFGINLSADGTIYYSDMGLTLDSDGPGPGAGLGSVRRIRFVAGDPLAPETIDSGLSYPDGIGILEELGIRAFSIKRPGSEFRSSALFGMDVSTNSPEPWLTGPLKLVAGLPDSNGIAPLRLAEDVIIGFRVLNGESVCFKLLAAGSQGSLDCDGGSAHDVLVTIDSHGEEPADAPVIQTGLGSDGGPGAATLRVMQATAQQPRDKRLSDCPTADYGPPQPMAYTTRGATGTVINARQDPAPSLTTTGTNFTCDGWSRAGGNPVLVSPLVAEDAPQILVDVVNLLVLMEQ
ncbi:MAG: hypothetical protein HY699_01830 [Deltaproteobacteria bacterium]|nr:hypothetical protein [Deltaproteobacteria bacterium]